MDIAGTKVNDEMNSARSENLTQDGLGQGSHNEDEPGSDSTGENAGKMAADRDGQSPKAENGEIKPALPMVVPQAEEAQDNGQKRPSFFRWLKKIFSKPQEPLAENSELAAVLAVEENMDFDFSPEERDMLHNIFRLRHLKVEDVMVARAEIKAVDTHISLGEILREFEKSGHSRMPVYDDGLDDPKGMIHLRDVLAYITKTAHVTRNEKQQRKTPYPASLDLKKVNLSKSVEKLNLIRPVLFVPPSMLAMDLMGRMQANRMHMALVIDEYGGTDGIVCMEDIVEIIVGDIEDEHDEDDSHMIVAKGDGVFVVDGRVDLEDLQEALGHKLDFDSHSEDNDTIGGVIFSLIGRVPVRGEVIEAFGYEMRILAADPRRIKSIEMAPEDPRKTKRKAARKPD